MQPAGKSAGGDRQDHQPAAAAPCPQPRDDARIADVAPVDKSPERLMEAAAAALVVLSAGQLCPETAARVQRLAADLKIQAALMRAGWVS